MPVAWPESTERAAPSASVRSSLPRWRLELAVGPVDLHHGDAPCPQPPEQPRPVRAGALDPDPVDHPQLRRPFEQLGAAGPAGRDLDRAQPPAELIERDRHADVGMRVDPEGDQPLIVWHLRHVRLLDSDQRRHSEVGPRTGLPRDHRPGGPVAPRRGPRLTVKRLWVPRRLPVSDRNHGSRAESGPRACVGAMRTFAASSVLSRGEHLADTAVIAHHDAALRPRSAAVWSITRHQRELTTCFVPLKSGRQGHVRSRSYW
jgi:hypothetical protein